MHHCPSSVSVVPTFGFLNTISIFSLKIVWRSCVVSFLHMTIKGVPSAWYSLRSCGYNQMLVSRFFIIKGSTHLILRLFNLVIRSLGNLRLWPFSFFIFLDLLHNDTRFLLPSIPWRNLVSLWSKSRKKKP